MQLFTATFVKNKCIFLAILLQQKLVLVMNFSSFRKGAGLRPKKCGAGAGWDGLRGGCGQNFSNSYGCRAGLNFAGADTKFQPTQDFIECAVP